MRTLWDRQDFLYYQQTSEKPAFTQKENNSRPKFYSAERNYLKRVNTRLKVKRGGQLNTTAASWKLNKNVKLRPTSALS